jgi:Ser/Thr protein kinase RdoA (MazF antagonist)
MNTPLQLPDNWPQTLNDWLQQAFGTPVELEILGGQSQASVYRVSFREKALIVKRSATPKEKLFYERVAPLLNKNGISTPRLERAEYADGFYWLILEAIPHPLPRQRWQGDAEIVATLRRLHTITSEPPPELPEIYRPQWTEELTALALEIFPEKARTQLEPLLSEIGHTYQYLFYPENLISGDPNPTNWGLREDGALVLFDWERFGHGTPALDLAITVGGM